MEIYEKRLEKFDKMYKDAFFEKIRTIYAKQAIIINLMLINAQKIGKLNNDIPNIGITLNNKLVELSQIFEKAGISMFISRAEDYDRISFSVIGDAIIDDLIQYINQGEEKICEYNIEMERVSDKKLKQLEKLKNVTLIQKIFFKVKSFFIPPTPIDLSLTEEEQEMLDKRIQEYREIDNQVWKYNLKDNIISSVVKYICSQRNTCNTGLMLLQEDIISDLQKLGLDELVPELQQTLIEEYKKDLFNFEDYNILNNINRIKKRVTINITGEKLKINIDNKGNVGKDILM